MAYNPGRMPQQFYMNPSALVPASTTSNQNASRITESIKNASSTFSMGKGLSGFASLSPYKPVNEGVMPGRMVKDDEKEAANILMKMKNSKGGRKTRRKMKRRSRKTLRRK